jgi:hypothetical protein
LLNAFDAEHRTAPRVLDINDPFGGMTSKMARFVDFSFSGMSDTEAYRQAYDTAHMTESSIYSAARDVAKNPLVTAKLRQLQDARDAKSTLLAFLNREYVLEGIMKIANTGDKDSVRLRAFELLGKTVGLDLFRETTRVERVDRTPADVDRELKERLQAMMLTIEGDAHPVEMPGAAKPQPAVPRDRRRKPAPK